jgi:hypothetical protein
VAARDDRESLAAKEDEFALEAAVCPSASRPERSMNNARCYLYDRRAPTGRRLAEPPPEPISEAELGWLWEGMRYPPEALATPDGRAVLVLNPGRRGGGAGPDFRDAVVVLDGVERRGDVELHLRASSFRGHGHDGDPAYARLALHVVYRADEGAETPLPGGGSAPVAAFAPWVERRAGDLRAWLAQPALWQEPCRSAGERLGDAAVSLALTAAGRERFAAARAGFARNLALQEQETVLWQALLEAIGYGGDRDGFRRLAVALSPMTVKTLVRSETGSDAAPVVEEALLAVAGLATREPWGMALPPPLSLPLAAVGRRPANRPERRLAAFARLYGRARGDFAAYARESVRAAVTPAALVAAWQVAARPGEKAALLGRARAQEIVVNVVLPFVAAVSPALAGAAVALLEALPALPPYGKTAFLERNLTGAGGKRRVRRALEQQGLLAFLKRWCSQGGCGRCPLS